MVVSFLPMLCIAYAFRELNKVDPDCGTTFTWTTRAFGPWTGWMGGWGIIAADIIVMASLSQIAGRYTFRLLGDDTLAANTFWVTVVGVLFIGLLTWICYRGIEVSARLQQALLAIEVVTLAIFAVVAFVKAGTGHALPGATTPSLHWLDPWTGSFSSLSNSFLLAVFVYWGWDCALSVNEETKDRAGRRGEPPFSQRSCSSRSSPSSAQPRLPTPARRSSPATATTCWERCPRSYSAAPPASCSSSAS